MPFFPTSNLKYSGEAFQQRNEETGDFYGFIKDIRPIKSNTNSTVFGVIEIEVPGKPGVFQDYLNYNPAKAQQNTDFIVSHAKQAVLSTGKSVNADLLQQSVDWAEKVYNQIKDEHLRIHFAQNRTSRGLNIVYIPQSEDQAQSAPMADQPAF